MANLVTRDWPDLCGQLFLSGAEMIGWVHSVLKSWGRAQYWVLFGKGGLPTRTMLGKLMEEGVVGASCSQFTMEYPEVLQGENLAVANAVKTLSEVPRTVVTVHYVLRLPTKMKYTKLGLARGTYYDTLSSAQARIANVMELQEARQSMLQRIVQNTQKVTGICQEGLG